MKLLITGDFCPINRAETTFSAGNMFGDFTDIIKKADLCITNLECPLTEFKTPIKKTGPALKAPAKYAEFLKKNGFDLVTLANNHIMDYGSQGIEDTIDALDKNNIDYVGAGKAGGNIDVIYKTFDSVKIAIVNLCENEWSTQDYNGYKANGFSEIGAFYSIREAKKNADKVIVIHHGGHETYRLPSPRLKKALRYFADCGADAVINHHTHCISGYEIYNGSPIFYSLGNFVFDNPGERDSQWNFGIGVTLIIDKNAGISHEIHYFEQFNHEPSIKVVSEKDIPYDISEVNKYIQDDGILEKEFRSFVNKKMKMYNTYLEPFVSKYYNALKNKGILPSMWNIRKRYYLKNLISCESHREIVQEILKRETEN